MTEPAGDQLTTPIGIDELTAADVDDVWELFRRLPDRDRTFVEHPVDDVDTVRRWLGDDRSRRFVARADRRVVGYLALSRGVGWSRHVGEIRLVVDPELRRRGLGLQLARHALAVAVEEGLAKVVVEVVADQESTIGLFTRLGFRAEALLVDQVRDPDGNDSDLLVLAHRPADDRRLLETVGLDVPLD